MRIRLTRLAAVLAFSTLLTAVGSAVVTYFVAEAEIRDLTDEDLERHAQLLVRWLAAQPQWPSGVEAMLRRSFEPDDEETLWVVIEHRPSGRWFSNLAYGAAPVVADDGELRREYDGLSWLGYQASAGAVSVQVLRRADRFAELREEVAEDIALPAIAAGAVNLLLLAVLIGMCLWPLAQLVRAIERRRGDRLDAITVAAPAHEIASLRDTLNALLADASAVLARERRFTDDIAHELRTPLTTLKLELAAEPLDRAALARQVTRIEYVVARLLTLARLAHGEHAGALVPLDLAHVLRPVIEDLDMRAGAAGLRLVAALAPGRVRGDATLLAILVENLVGNAITHAGTATRIRLDVEAGHHAVTLRVADDGPGVAPEFLAHMAGDFERLDSRGGGLGLGLAICHRIAALHSARITFLAPPPPGHGFIAEVVFPALSPE